MEPEGSLTHSQQPALQTVFLLNVSTTLVAILRDVHYKRWIYLYTYTYLRKVQYKEWMYVDISIQRMDISRYICMDLSRYILFS